jgi:hypothetical protein
VCRRRELGDCTGGLDPLLFRALGFEWKILLNWMKGVILLSLYCCDTLWQRHSNWFERIPWMILPVMSCSNRGKHPANGLSKGEELTVQFPRIERVFC